MIKRLSLIKWHDAISGAVQDCDRQFGARRALGGAAHTRNLPWKRWGNEDVESYRCVCMSHANLCTSISLEMYMSTYPW